MSSMKDNKMKLFRNKKTVNQRQPRAKIGAGMQPLEERRLLAALTTFSVNSLSTTDTLATQTAQFSYTAKAAPCARNDLVDMDIAILGFRQPLKRP